MASVLRVMHDPKLLGPWFQPHPEHGDTWLPWRAWVKSTFGTDAEGPLTEAEAAFVRGCTGRDPALLPPEGFPEAALAVSRRAGKSKTLAAVCIAYGIRDWKAHLSLGERALVACFASDRKQSRAVFGQIRAAFQSIPLLAGLVEDMTTDSIHLKNSVSIEVMTVSGRGARGYAVCCAVLDEVSFYFTEGPRADADLVASLRPGLATLPGAKLIMASSPYARRGVLWDAFVESYGQDADAELLFWRAASRTMNPTIPESLVQRAIKRDQQAANSEWLGQWRDDVSSYCDPAVARAAVEVGRFENTPGPAQYAAYCDPSGGSVDSFALCIAHREGRDPKTARIVVDACREWRAPFAPDAVVEAACSELKRWGCRKVTGDAYGSGFVVDSFKRHGVEYAVSDRTKSDTYLEFLPLLNSRRVALPGSERLLSQLTALERRTARGGRESVDHPPNGHDDLINACAGAVVLAAEDRTADMERRWTALTADASALAKANIWYPDPAANAAEAARNRVFLRLGGLFPRYRQ